MQAADLPTIVRVPSREYHHIARAADMGAEGVMVPMVGSPDEARAILDCLKYVPVGRRGVALGIAHDRYLPGPTMDKPAGRQPVDHAVRPDRDPARGSRTPMRWPPPPGVDCLWIGHFDLSCSLGIPGEFGHKDFTDAVKAVAKACKSHGKALGRLVPTVEEAVRLRAQGFDFLCYSGDPRALQGAVQAGIAAIRVQTAPAVKAQIPGQHPSSKSQAKKEKITGAEATMRNSRFALSGDFKSPDSSLSLPTSTSQLPEQDWQAIEFRYIRTNGVITAQDLQGFDALILF